VEDGREGGEDKAVPNHPLTEIVRVAAKTPKSFLAHAIPDLFFLLVLYKIEFLDVGERFEGPCAACDEQS